MASRLVFCSCTNHNIRVRGRDKRTLKHNRIRQIPRTILLKKKDAKGEIRREVLNKKSVNDVMDLSKYLLDGDNNNKNVLSCQINLNYSE